MPYNLDENRGDIRYEVDGDKLILKVKSGVFPSGGNLDLYIIKERDTTLPTDENVFSAKRVLKEIEAIKDANSVSFGDLFEVVEYADKGTVRRAIKAKMDFFSVGEITAYGTGSHIPSLWDSLPIASTAVKGIAQFHPDYFNVENGIVSLKDGVGGLDETKLDQYLNSHNYITSSYLSENKYFTESGLSTYLTTHKYLTETSLKDKLDLKLDKSVWDEAFEIVETSGVKRIKAKMSLFSVGELTAYGAGDSIPSLWDSLPVASTTSKGIAQFNPAFFAVNAGLVTLRSDLDFGLNEGELASYLTSNHYITETILSNKGYATELFVNQKCTALSTSLTAEIAKKWTTDTTKISAWDKNITDLSSHIADTVKHVSATERTTWNNKLDKSIWDEAFEVVGTAGNRKIKAKLSLFSVGELTAYMVGDGGDSSLWDSLPVASTTAKGIAQFNPAFFTVNAGLVTLRSDLDFGLNESELTSFLGNNNYAKKTDNVASATKLLNARTIALSGAVTGHGSFDGSGNLTIPTAFAQNFDAKYVLKTGDTMSGVLNLVAIKSTNNFNYAYINTCLAAFNYSASTITGTIKITLPFSWTNSMNVYKIVVYEYNSFSASEIIIGGYDYNAGANSNWVNHGYSVLGAYNKGVRLAYDGSKTCILLGTTSTVWNYPAVFLDTVYASFSGSVNNNWSKGYSISIITSESGYTNIASPSERNQSKFDGRYVKRAGDSMSGYLTVPGIYLSNNNVSSNIKSENSSYLHYNTNAPSGHYFNKVVNVAGEIYAGPSYNQKVWHQGNDGAGSGLDADLLDGYQSNKFYIDGRGNIANGQIDTFVLRDSGSYSYNFTGASRQLTVFASKGGSCSAVEIESHYANYHRIRTVIDNNRYSGWLDLITSSNYSNYVYSKTDADSRFVNVTGDTMTGVLNFNMSNLDPVIWVKQNGTNKGAFGWSQGVGIAMTNSVSGGSLGILNNGNPHFNTYSLYCENNAGTFYKWSRATRNSYHVWDLSNTTTYNVNTYYPVTITLATNEMTRHEIQVSLDSGTKPSWSTHAQGYSVRLVWEENGAGWGTIPVVRKIISATYSFAAESPIGGITQLTNSSTCVLWLRGGGKYFYYSNGQRTKGGPYTTQQTISQQTFTTLTLDEARQGWVDLARSFSYSENEYIGSPRISGAINLYGNNNAGISLNFYWNGRNKSVSSPTSIISESASGRLSISSKLAVGTTGAVSDSYALSATSFYSSGNLTCNGVSSFSGTVNTNSINASTITCSNWLRTTGSTGWYSETYGGGWYMADTTYLRAYSNKAIYTGNTGYNSINTAGGVLAANGFIINNSAGTGIGISLYASTSASNPTYGIMFAKTSSYGTHGTVNADWATYFTMSNSNGRGWVFKKSGSTNVVSISTYGDIYADRNILAKGEVTAYSASDIRLKTHIRPISNPFKVLKRARPVLFKWNKTAFELNAERPCGDVPGMIAQWEEAVLPVAIHSVYEKYLGIKYESYIPYLIAGVNEHETEIQSLKKRIRELEQEVEQLKVA